MKITLRRVRMGAFGLHDVFASGRKIGEVFRLSHEEGYSSESGWSVSLTRPGDESENPRHLGVYADLVKARNAIVKYLREHPNWEEDVPTPERSYIGLRFTLTCRSIPEQYDVHSGTGSLRGYVRLRSGRLTADYYPDGLRRGGVRVFEHHFRGNDSKGSFDTESERDGYLRDIAAAIKARELVRGRTARGRKR